MTSPAKKDAGTREGTEGIPEFVLRETKLDNQDINRRRKEGNADHNQESMQQPAWIPKAAIDGDTATWWPVASFLCSDDNGVHIARIAVPPR